MRINPGQIYENLDGLESNYGMYVRAIKEEIDESGNRSLNDFSGSEIESASLMILLDNARNKVMSAKRAIDESGMASAGLSTLSTVKNIETTLFDLFTGTAASMLAYRVVAVQPIQTPNAYVYYFEYKYAKAKGAIKAGDTLLSHISSKTLGYAGSNIYGEAIATAAAETTHILAYTPVIPGTVKLYDGVDVLVDNGKGGFTSNAGTTVWATAINYTTGAVVYDATKAANAGAHLSASYRYDTEVAESNPITAELVSKAVTAEVKTLKTTSTLAAILNSKSVLGIDLTEVSLEVATRELAAEFDFDIFVDIMDKLEHAITIEAFDKSVEDYDSFDRRFLKEINAASNLIFNATQKLEASFIIAGTELASVIESSNGFVAYDNSTNYASGPRLIGKLGNKEVIKVPTTVFDENEGIIGAKSDIPVLGAGYIFAPYIMAFPSQLLIDADLKAQQGFISMAAKTMVNSDLYVKVSLI